MDGNGLPINSYGLMGAPAAYLAAVTDDVFDGENMAGDASHTDQDRLTEAEKEDIIMQCKDARSKDKVEKIIEERVPDGYAHSIFEGPATR